MKTIGIILAFIACASLGFLSTARTKNRERTLASLRADLIVLRQAVEQEQLPLSQAVKRLKEGALWRFLTLYLEKMREEKDGDEAFHAAWNEAMETLSMQEKTACALYFKSLRHGDRFAVRDAGERLMIGLDEACKAAETAVRQGKVYRAVGVLGGAALVIMLL